MLYECHLEDFVWRAFPQVEELVVCFGILPDYAMSALCEFYCNSYFPLAYVVLPLRNFFPVHFAGLVKKPNHSISTLLSLG